MNDDGKKARRTQRPGLARGARLRDARHPCRRAARPDHRRAHHADLSDDGLRLRRSVDHAASLFDLSTFGYIYSRLTNPTVAALEERIASLEGGRGATACASGHAAQMLAFFSLMEPGDAVRRLEQALWRLDHPVRQDLQEVRLGGHLRRSRQSRRTSARALTPKCKAIFVESLANPGGVIVDIEPIAAIAHEAGIPLIVDNTLATPYLCRPFEWGADIVIHSTTKFLCGHGNSMGGVVVEFRQVRLGAERQVRRPDRARSPPITACRFYETFGDMALIMHTKAVGLRDLGPTLSPMNAFLTLTGIETLAAAHGAPLRQCAEGRRVPGRPSRR